MLRYKEYDAVVVGAGLAGSMAARKIAEAGYRVVLVEKRQEIGNAVRCAEGVSEKWLLKHTGIKPSWISKEIKGAILISPSGVECKMDFPDKGLILERKVFDYDLAVMAANAGSELFAKTAVTKIAKISDDSDYNYLVKLEGFIDAEIKTKIVIAADGVESKVGRMLGVNTTVEPNDIEFCMQYTVNNIDVDPDYSLLIGGNELAPGGYVWVFPKGDRSANIGLGVVGSRCSKEKNADYYLRKFVKEKYPNGTISRVIPGADAVCKPLTNMSGDGFMIAGDAARLANPISGAGIGNALESGAIAGETAVLALKKKNLSAKFFKKYDKEVNESVGNTTKHFHKIKNVFVKLTDSDMDGAVSVLSKLDKKNITVKKILEIVFKENKTMLSILKKIIFR